MEIQSPFTVSFPNYTLFSPIFSRDSCEKMGIGNSISIRRPLTLLPTSIQDSVLVVVLVATLSGVLDGAVLQPLDEDV